MRTLSISLGLFALFFVSPAFADSVDTFDQVSAQVDQAKQLANSQCGQAAKKEFQSVGQAISASRAACKELRQCKQTARRNKRSAKRDARQAKRDCKKSCKGLKGKAKKACKKSCRQEKKSAKRDARQTKRAAIRECRAQYKTSQCRAARRQVGKSLLNTVRALASDKDCQQKAQQLANSIQQGS